MPLKLRSIVFCILFLSLSASAQKAPKVKRRDTYDPKTLAHALTDGLTNDSDKVKNIFLWISANIRYGIPFEDPRTILRYRKAVCLGMSILFDTLCAEAGIDAVLVPGYVYMPWYEARDTLFIDTHAWNAVNIDGKWELLDITWSRGYLKLRRQPIRRAILGIFHGTNLSNASRINITVYHPK
jgi:hypothetical protein